MAIKVSGAKKKKKRKKGLAARARGAVKKLAKRVRRGKAGKKKAGTSTSG